MTADQIIADIERDLEERVRAVAEQFEAEVKSILSVQAPIEIGMPTRDRPRAVRASTPAAPGAPPRRVTGALQRSIRRRQVDRFEYQVGNFGGAPYGAPLELVLDHRFLGVVRDGFRADAGPLSRYGPSTVAGGDAF